MNNLKILHITPWFPNPENETEAIFIARHINSLIDYCENKVLHIKFDNKISGCNLTNVLSVETVCVKIKPLFNKWRIKEFQANQYINRYLKIYGSNFDIVNFHIAYPNCTKISDLVKKFPSLKFLITEHWTAYHNNFGLSENSKGRKRIANIFNNNVPLFVVSNALGEDIRTFSGLPEKHYKVIPNIVDSEFDYKEKKVDGNFIFSSINNWNPMKNPFVLIEAFNELKNEYENIKLILGGHGWILPEMKAFVKNLGLDNYIEFTGRLNKIKVLELLQQSHVYCQSSNYETFSVICAEALSTGTPVIATNIGGVKDFVNTSNGILVDDLESESWYQSMKYMIENYKAFNRKVFSEETKIKFSRKTIGNLYYENLQAIVADEFREIK